MKTAVNDRFGDRAPASPHASLYALYRFFGRRQRQKYQLDLVTIVAPLTDHSDITPTGQRRFKGKIPASTGMVVDLFQH